MMLGGKAISLVELIDQARLAEADIRGNMGTRITGISTNAQTTQRNNLFVAIRGTRTDSHALIGEAVARGASAVVVECGQPSFPGVTVIWVPDTRKALGPLAHAFYGNPSRAMRMAAVTGTNGKTTTCGLLTSIMRCAGMRSATVGTCGAYWNDKYRETNTTTPDPLTLASWMAEMEADGVEFVAFEASSHGIDQARIGGLAVHAGILTNVTQDHIDYHKTFSNYVAAKKKLFFEYAAETEGSVCVFNYDDPTGEELCTSYQKEFVSYSPSGRNKCDVTIHNVTTRPQGTEFELRAGGKSIEMRAQLVGLFNVSNIAAAAAAAYGMGVDISTIAQGIAACRPLAGRLEPVREGQPFHVFVDYSHTPDALEKALRAVRQLTTGEVIVAFGCGGDRDKIKRPQMGMIAGDLADQIIVTTDNPRYEDPNLINRDINEGLIKCGVKMSRFISVLDRAHAIERALVKAKPGDAVLIAGKGHETYQEICGTRYQFDDRQVASDILKSMADNWPYSAAKAQFETA